MKPVMLNLKSLFVTGVALVVVFAVTLFLGASTGSAGPETTNEPAVNPYVHVESSPQYAQRNGEQPARANDATQRNLTRR